MRRREFITLIGGSAVWPLAARAQRPRKVYRIGLLLPGTSAIVANNPRVTALFPELRALGWIERQNVVFERRLAEGQLGRLDELAADLVRSNVDVIITAAAPSATAAKEATSTIPIVILD